MHVAMQNIRRLDITWSGDEVGDYDSIKNKGIELQKDAPTYVKEILKKFIDKE